MMLPFVSRLYRVLLHLYPAGFYREYGVEMAQVFDDECARILRESGFFGLFGWCLHALGDLSFTVILEHFDHLRSHPMKTMRAILPLLLFLLTLPAVLFALTLMTNFIFAPWDTALHRPELGTWQRTLNDFFETAPGVYTFSLPLMIANIYFALRRGNLLTLAGINFAFVLLFWVALLASFFVNNAVFPYPPVLYDPNYDGYHRAIIPAAVFALVCFGWMRVVSYQTSRRQMVT